MMKTKSTIRILLLIFLFTVGEIYSQATNGAVGINTSAPNLNSVLDVVSSGNNKGVLMPRLTETQRDAIVINPATDDGLTIFNITEDCYNYWSLADNEWKSVCGQIGKSVFTIDCSNSKAMGTYIQGKELTASNYLSVSVNVTKIGNYTITGTTTNGYNFYGTGVFLNTGIQTVQIPGQGTPTAVQVNTVQLSANGVDVTCTPAVTINVLSPAGTYTMSCGSAIVNGVYKVGTALAASNTITLPVNVSSLGSYTVTTNTVDGISFSGSGTFTATGNQNITLSGTGTPSSTSIKTMTITSNSQGGVSTTCSVNVIVVIPAKTIVHLGGTGDHGYSAEEDASKNLMDAPANFGTLANSVVKFEGFTHLTPADGAPAIAAINAKPDIVITGYPYTPNAAEITALVDYLNKGGVVIAQLEGAASIQSLMRSLFANPQINVNGRNGGGAVYPMINISDEILNGPFGDVRGKNWGEDASATASIDGISEAFITSYTGSSAINSTSVFAGTTMFRHKNLNLFYVGDAGFLSNFNANGTIASNTAYPFATNTSNFPVAKTAYGTTGNGNAAGSMAVQNSIIFANVVAWAIKQAEFNGINTP
ncbi:hypothetical protein [Chryseobacterium sp. 3008163]|uniref:hypothetical protein n=1 Tax=Chryseobacterium sp. 3008163 TaxID=2478663 RepID=UPI000F0C9DAE|nr:hypothetical protein [Chryseobacterium sp. 3008163]AYN00571.1 hypothetical protein EAG08_09800 [Chryseobacterium sp. 3008163]